MRARLFDAPGVVAGVVANVAPTRGGVPHKHRGVVPQAPSLCAPVFPRLFRERASFPIRVSGEGQDGSDPPFFALPAERQGGGATEGATEGATPGVTYSPPLLGGSLPSYVSLREGPPRRRQADTAPRSGGVADAVLRAVVVVLGVSAGAAWTWPGPFPEADPLAVLVRLHTPSFYKVVVGWYYLAPGVAVWLAGQFLLSSSRIWFAHMGVRLGLRSTLPTWPLSPTSDGPAIVIGEVHHPVRAIESPTPEWLVIPERGLYTGVAIFGAVGSGKTSACMHPFARQLLSWHAANPERRVAALVLEVKGDFCHDIKQILVDAHRARTIWK